MIYKVQDIQQFQAQQQFIDTAIVPLVQLDFDPGQIVQNSSDVDFLMALASFVELQFKGRVVLIPPFSYFSKTENEELLTNLKQQLHKAGFKTVIFMTCDNAWNGYKESSNIIWLPAIPLDSMDNNVKQRIFEEQLKQIIPVLTNAWS